jgi:hypothetical protein
MRPYRLTFAKSGTCNAPLRGFGVLDCHEVMLGSAEHKIEAAAGTNWRVHMKDQLEPKQAAGHALRRSVALVLLCMSSAGPSFAQSSNEANRMLSGIQDSDPQGFTWMFVCIGILLTCAVTLITATTVLAAKGKKGS